MSGFMCSPRTKGEYCSAKYLCFFPRVLFKESFIIFVKKSEGNSQKKKMSYIKEELNLLG